MGLRWRKTVRVSKKTKVNVGTQKASVSLGQPGMTVNVSRRGARATVGLPGTGLSYVTKQVGGSRKRGSFVEEVLTAIFIVFLLGILRAICRGLTAAIGAVFSRRRPEVAAPPARPIDDHNRHSSGK